MPAPVLHTQLNSSCVLPSVFVKIKAKLLTQRNLELQWFKEDKSLQFRVSSSHCFRANEEDLCSQSIFLVSSLVKVVTSQPPYHIQETGLIYTHSGPQTLFRHHLCSQEPRACKQFSLVYPTGCWLPSPFILATDSF